MDTTNYTTEPDGGGLTVRIRGVGASRDRLLGAFQECRDGGCDCPTDEYDKLASMSIVDGRDSITVRLDSRPGETFDLTDIEACLDHTVRRAEQAGA